MNTEQQLANLRADYRGLGEKIINLSGAITQAETDRLVGDRQDLARSISRLEQQIQQ